MKLYRASHSGISEGLRLTQHDRLGWVVALGEQGSGRWLECIKLDGKRPPSITTLDDQKLVYEATVIAFKDGARTRHALVSDDEAPSNVLVEICTGPDCIRGGCGTTEPATGQPNRVTGGKGALGESGRLGSWDHSLWIMAKGDGILVSPAGAAAAYVVYFDGMTVRTYGTKEFRTLMGTPVSQA